MNKNEKLLAKCPLRPAVLMTELGLGLGLGPFLAWEARTVLVFPSSLRV